jgi:hypothetical protein
MVTPSEPRKPPLSVVRAWSFLGVNLLATPGLGSIWGGRKLAGRGQLFFSIVGFCLIVGWIFKLSLNISAGEINGTDSAPVPPWLWRGGLLAFGIGWLWSLITSIGMVLEAGKVAKNSKGAPPKLGGSSRPIPPKL